MKTVTLTRAECEGVARVAAGRYVRERYEEGEVVEMTVEELVEFVVSAHRVGIEMGIELARLNPGLEVEPRREE